MDLLSFAKTIADRVETAASRAAVPVAVCVIDTHGNVILKHHMKSGRILTVSSCQGRRQPSSCLKRLVPD